MDVEIDKLINQVQVVFQIILLLWVLIVELVNAVVLFNQIGEAKCNDEEMTRRKSECALEKLVVS